VSYRQILLVILLGVAPHILAHDARPVLIDIENRAGLYRVLWKIPPVIPTGLEPTVRLENCRQVGPLPRSLVGSMNFDCSAAKAVYLLLDWPALNPALSTLVSINAVTQLYGPEEQRISLYGLLATSAFEQAMAFVKSGIVHLLIGLDHLFFLAAMTLIVLNGDHQGSRFRRLIILVTGFTVAHSLTLALASLSSLSLPAPPVEACIALSVVFVSLELTRRHRTTLTWRYQALTASVFGLLHGLGFANILQASSMAEGQRILGLFSFNLGVEIAQLIFVFCLCVVIGGMKAILSAQWCRRALTISVYGMGSWSSFWLVQRLAGF
jgi:hypothetical protein